MADYQPKKQIVLVANGDPPSPKLFYTAVTPHASLIAVDGGFHICRHYQRLPELVLGDFDSTEEKLIENYPTVQTKSLPDQNKTDLEKVLEYLFTFSPEKIIVLGALGRRVDHTYKNLELLTHYPKVLIFQTLHEHLFALPQKETLACGKGTCLSLIPFGNVVTKVKTSGLKWELEGEDLTHMSISNLAVKETISIEFEQGHLLCALNSS